MKAKVIIMSLVAFTVVLLGGTCTAVGSTAVSGASVASSEPPPNFGPIRNILYLECLNCHTRFGNSISPSFPRIAGQEEFYLETELKAFRSQKRADPDAIGYMYGPASSLSDTQIHLLAEYFSEQTPLPNEPGDPAKAKLGEVIFMNGLPKQGVPPCFACHGANAQGTDIAPRLAGQWSGYIVRQLEAFKNGEREEATVMPTFARFLTRDQEKDVASYLQGLR